MKILLYFVAVQFILSSAIIQAEEKLESGAACFVISVAQQAAAWREFSQESGPSDRDVTTWSQNAKEVCIELEYAFADGELDMLQESIPTWMSKLFPSP